MTFALQPSVVKTSALCLSAGSAVPHPAELGGFPPSPDPLSCGAEIAELEAVALGAVGSSQS